jgi:HD-GYP domain-containing protein (c-di-GMP phosphodiesterase class II)
VVECTEERCSDETTSGSALALSLVISSEHRCLSQNRRLRWEQREQKKRKMVKDLSTERRRALNESQSNQESNEESNEEGKKEERRRHLIAKTDLWIFSSDEELEEEPEGQQPAGCQDQECDDRDADDLPEEPPIDWMYCSYCLQTPCVFLQYQDEMERIVEVMYQQESNRTKRYHLYRRMSQELHGPLGKGCRKPLPKCFVQGFRDLYPDEADNYTGFRDGQNNNDDSVTI